MHQHAPSVFFIVQKLSSVSAAVDVLSSALTVRQIVLPLAFISIPRNISISTISISHSVSKITLIQAAIRFDEPSLTLTTPPHKLPLKIVAAVKVQDTVTVGHLTQHFSLVICTKPLNVKFPTILKVVGLLRYRRELLQSRLNPIWQVGLNFSEIAGAKSHMRVQAFVEGGIRLQSLEWRGLFDIDIDYTWHFDYWRSCLTALLTHPYYKNDQYFNSKTHTHIQPIQIQTSKPILVPFLKTTQMKQNKTKLYKGGNDEWANMKELISKS